MEYSKEDILAIERMMLLRSIEPGEILTERQYETIRFFLGDLIDKAKAIKETSVSIYFDRLGAPHSIDNNGMIKSVNGVPVNEPLPDEKEPRE
jgi:hypothetical protein